MPGLPTKPTRMHHLTPPPKLVVLTIAFVATICLLTGQERQYRNMSVLEPEVDPTHEPPASIAKAKVQEASRPPIQQISLLGERNSGTRWTYE